MTTDHDEMSLVEGRNSNPWTARPDWISFAPVSPTARELYTVLAGHLNQARGDRQVWPSRDALADILGYSSGRKIDKFLDELIAIDAVERRHTRDHGGMRARNSYVVHTDPPPGWQHPTSYPEYYARRKREKSQVGSAVPKQGPREDSEKPQVGSVVPTRGLREVPTRGLREVPTRGLEPDEVQPDEHQQSSSARARAGDDDGDPSGMNDGATAPGKDTGEQSASEPASGGMQERARVLLESLRMPHGPAFTVHVSAVTAVAAQLDAGHSEDAITATLMDGVSAYKIPAAGITARIRDLARLLTDRETHSATQRPTSTAPSPVCGQCEARDGDPVHARQEENPATGAVRRCPRCHPKASTDEGQSVASLASVAAAAIGLPA